MVQAPVFIKARVCTRIDNETVCTVGQKKIIVNDFGDTKGTMLDGREVVKIDNWWYYIPPNGNIMSQWTHEERKSKPAALIEGKPATRHPAAYTQKEDE